VYEVKWHHATDLAQLHRYSTPLQFVFNSGNCKTQDIHGIFYVNLNQGIHAYTTILETLLDFARPLIWMEFACICSRDCNHRPIRIQLACAALSTYTYHRSLTFKHFKHSSVNVHWQTAFFLLSPIVSYVLTIPYHSPSGFAHLRLSILPVFGHRISCHDTGSMVAPVTT